MMNRLFVANKPTNISSNHFLTRLKRKYGVKKAGFSGTLDPFASGVLIIAFGNYTRLFNYLTKSPKIYEATLWLGALSQSLDNENIEKIDSLKPFSFEKIESIRQSLLGFVDYIPPKFSAKKVNGQRAYKLARNGAQFDMKTCTMEIFSSKILHYNHPFLSFEICVSEGGYVRSYAEIFTKKLNCNGTLSSLKRIKEGKFTFENEITLNPLDYLNIKKNYYFKDYKNILDGKKLSKDDFQIKEDGEYLLNLDNSFSIIKIDKEEVKYCLNKVEIC